MKCKHYLRCNNTVPKSNIKNKVFCSAGCRVRYYNFIKKKSIKDRLKMKCKECGRSLTKSGSDATYCDIYKTGRRCYQNSLKNN